MANIPLLKADLCHLTFVGIPRKTWVEALLTVIDTDMEKYIAPQDQADVRAVVIQAVKELHEGKLVSFKLSRSEFAVWKDAQK